MLRLTALVAVFALLEGTLQAVTIETVPVRNLGNVGEQSRLAAGDSTYYGGVDYAYNIGKYEVTAGQYCEFLNAVAATDTYGLYKRIMDTSNWGSQITRHGLSGSYRYDFSGRPSGREADWSNRPVAHVSWGDAARFANWLHNGQPSGAQGSSTTEDGAYDLSATQSYYGPDGRVPDKSNDPDEWNALNSALVAAARKPNWKWAIPSEDEWYKAAYHKNDGMTGNYFVYPTSSDSVPSNALITPDPGNNANFSDPFYSIGPPYYRTEVGAHENSLSPYNTFDQAGNALEWNEAIDGTFRGLRGGSYVHQDGHVGLQATVRYSGYPATKGTSFGFRVVEVPEPGSITLLVCGILGLLAYEWRKRQR